MRTKEKIVQESRDFFTKYGYEETSMAMIAEQVGIKKPSLYAHYKSKEEIFISVLEHEAADYVKSIENHLKCTDQPSLNILYGLLIEHALYDGVSADFYYRYARYQPLELQAAIAEQYEETDAFISKLFFEFIERGKENGEIDPSLSNAQVYDTYFLMIDGLSSTPVMLKEDYKRKGVEHIWEVFKRGISPQ